MRNFRKAFAMVLVVCMLVFTGVVAYADGNTYTSGKADIGVTSLYYELTTVSGASNKPLVVFETALCDAHDSEVVPGFKGVEPLRDAIKDKIDTLVYDRAGLGQSNTSYNPRTTISKVNELHALINNLGLGNRKIIFVAHSFGGYDARVYTSFYRDSVAGVILIDASSENMFKGFEPILKGFGEDVWEGFKSAYDTPESTFATATESADQVANLTPVDALRNIPLTVITATNHEASPDMEALWANWQNDMASLSDKSTHIVVDGASHYLQTEQPQLVIDEINNMINKVSGN